MSKSKSTSKGAKSAKSDDILTKVKDAAIIKPAQTIKAKSKDLAKMVAGKEEKKEKKNKKKTKEPTPEPSESEESESSESSASESEVETTKKSTTKAQPKKAAAKAESSDDSESDESDAEAPKANGVTKKAEPTAAKAKAQESSDESESDGDESMADAAPANKTKADSDSENESSEESSDDEKPAKKATSKSGEIKNVAEDESDSDSEDGSDADSESSDDSEDEAEAAPKPSKRKAEEAVDQSAKKSKTETVDTSKGANLFVGNLSWNVDEAWLREVFEEFGELSSVRIMTDRQSGRSKGFGYVEFVQPEDAAKAHAAKAGADLDGRSLNVDFANARPDNSQKQENRRKSYGDQVSEPSDTLFLGNLSFEVGQETVTEAFAPHGQILGIRLPTDRDTGNPKGFGYVTFASIEEATGALEAMQGAYIEGRPVRLDYSSPRPQNSDSPARGRGGFGGRGAARGGRGGRGGSFGGRGDRGGRGGRGGGRGGSTNRGGFGDFSGRKTSFD